MAQGTEKPKTVEFEVLPDEVDGWDLRKAGEEQALSNHRTREQAELAARLRGEEEEATDVRVTVNERTVHQLDDDTSGVRPAFLYLAALLAGIVLLIAVLALVGSLTGFGAGWS
jgi:cytochrome c-type biogenesis protein CcmH/NrfG